MNRARILWLDPGAAARRRCCSTCCSATGWAGAASGWLACGAVGAGVRLVAWRSVLRLAGLPPRSTAPSPRRSAPGCASATSGRTSSFLLDPLSAVMILVVTGVGFLIHVYSTGYMAHDRGVRRFFAYLNLFMFAMLMLVLARQLPAHVRRLGGRGPLLLPADRLLVREARRRPTAGKKAFIVNRIGDFGFLLGMMLVFGASGTLRLRTTCSRWRRSCSSPAGAVVTAIALLLFVGATGKTAQIPLYVWLPDAMEGPTPVSALIHAATMVTAGVYMVARTPRALRAGAGRARGRGAGSARPPRSSPRRSAWCRTTSSACSPTRPSASSATCSWPAASARSPPASST